jgi:hypothetical protein
MSLERILGENEIRRKTGHFILAGVYTEEDLGINKD